MAKSKKKVQDEVQEQETATTVENEATEASGSDNTQTANAEDDTVFGTVVWNDKKKKGFGFIQMDGEKQEEGNDIFMHHSQIMAYKDGKVPNLEAGDRVSFILVDPPESNSKQKPIASEVVLEEKAPKEDKPKEESKSENK